MTPLSAIRSPTSQRGRPPISGTVLANADGDRYVAVRCAYSLGEDAGLSVSPRAEVWVALSETDFSPILVRGSGYRGSPLEWVAFDAWHEVGEVRREEAIEALRLATHDRSLSWISGPQEDRPRTIWDRRVILPGDHRYPRSKYPLAASLKELLARRNICPDEEVPAIDAMIMNLAPRAVRG